MVENFSQLKQGIDKIKLAVKNMPAKPGVYKMLDADKAILYVGKAKNLPKRVSSYANIQGLPNRLRLMVSQIDMIETLITETESQALLLEAHLIKSLRPRFNIDFKDDKSYPYIYADTSHEFPRLLKYRGQKMPKGQYFGPFASNQKVDETLAYLHKAFLIRNCSDNFFATRQRPCLQYQIKRCSAPCVNKISASSYQKSFQESLDFLSGKHTKIQQQLAEEMHKASEKLEYEKAASIRDKIQSLTKIQSGNIIAFDDIENADLIIAYQNQGYSCIQVFFIRGTNNFGHKTFFPSNTEGLDDSVIISNFLSQFYQTHVPPTVIMVNVKKTSEQKMIEDALSQIASHKVSIKSLLHSKYDTLLNFIRENAKHSLNEYVQNQAKIISNLQAVQTLFNLPKLPNRIEVYDSSHLQGTNAVGCMIVAGRYGFEKKNYRTFTIKNISTNKKGGDDYAMLQEVLARRLAKLADENYPDLIMIDGGKGHLTAAWEVASKLKLEKKLKIVCIAKGKDRNAGREWFFQNDKPAFQLPEDDPTLYYLQILRDEAHRYAITSHRNKRRKLLKTSVLDNIPGIGKARKRALLNIFISPEALKEANIDEICKVPGIDKKLAESIHDYLKEIVT
jgi:excinuclease ABC subunit C